MNGSCCYQLVPLWNVLLSSFAEYTIVVLAISTFYFFFVNQTATTTFKEQCGLPTVAKLKECIQSLATRLQSPEGAMAATMVLKGDYPYLEATANLSESTRKVITAYETVSKTDDP